MQTDLQSFTYGAYCYVGSDGPRDIHTGAALPDYEGPIMFYHNGERTLMDTMIIDGERHYGNKAFFSQEPSTWLH